MGEGVGDPAGSYRGVVWPARQDKTSIGRNRGSKFECGGGGSVFFLSCGSYSGFVSGSFQL